MQVSQNRSQDECFDRQTTKIKYMTEGILVRRQNANAYDRELQRQL
jgi:HrpA-like RNA helicase